MFGYFVASGLSLFLDFLDAAFYGFEVFQLEFGVDDFLVAYRVYTAVYVCYILIVETTEYVQDSIGFTDVCKEFVTQSFAFAGSFYQTGNIYDFYSSRNNTVGIYQFGQFVEAVIRYCDYTDIWFDGTEREIGSLGLCI